MKTKLKSIFMYFYSLCFCLKYLPFKEAIKVPIYISPSVRIKHLKKGDILFDCPPSRSMILIGYEGTVGIEQQKATIHVINGGRIVFHGVARFMSGTSLYVNGGTLSIGDDCSCNSNCFFDCNHANITIEDGSRLGWNVVMNTYSGKNVYMDGIEKPKAGDIHIGKHVWVCSYCHISKNVKIAEGCIVSQRSLVLKDQLVEHALIGGNPAKILKKSIDWKS